MKKTYYIVLLLLFLFWACTKKNAANPTTAISEDSLSVYLTKASDYNLTEKQRAEYTQKAYITVINQPNDSIGRVNLFKVANRYYNLNDWKGYKETVTLTLEKSEISKDTAKIAKAYTYLGDYYQTQGVPDSAFSYYFKAEKMFNTLKDNYNLARTRLNKANLQFNQSDFSGSEISAIKALSVLREEKKSELFYEILNLLGIIYNELGEFDKAIEYQNKALASIDANTPVEFQARATSLNNIGLLYQNENKHKEAIPYFQLGLAQKKELMVYKPDVYAMMLDNLGYSRLKLNQSLGLPGLFYQALKLRDSLQLSTAVIVSKMHLSEYYGSRKDTARSIRYSKEALKDAQTSNNLRNALMPLKRLSLIDPKREAAYSKLYIHINDSLQKADRNVAEKFSRIEYETDEIKILNEDLEVKNRNLVYIAGSIFILGLFLYIIRVQKSKTRELQFKREQQKVNEEIYSLMISQQSNVESMRIIEKKRVAQELHDGVLGRMFGVRMNLDSLNKLHDKDAMQERINYLSELKSIEQDIREISHDLNREKSELINNFVAIVDNLLEEQKKTFTSKLVSNIDLGIKWELVKNTVKINLYRIVQESLQNINKYAFANNIRLEFKKEGPDLFLTITDDGIGFNVNRAKKGIGLQNMLSRTNECEGTFEIKSIKGEGTIITVTVPFEQNT